MIIHYSTQIYLDRGLAILAGEEAVHCAKVLRSRIGDEVYVTDGQGLLCYCRLVAVDRSLCEAEIISSELYPKPSYQLTIAICPTKKQSRIEWFVEKAVEIGVSRIILTHTQRTEKKRLKEDRLHKIIISAMKQSKNLYLPELIIDMKWNDLICLHDYGQKYIAHCEDPKSHLSKVCMSNTDCIVAIGPEGDFTQQEIASALELDWKEVNLGNSRLRTETAGIVVASILSQINI